MESNLKKARLDKGFRGEFVAWKLGISFQTLYNWERGKSKPSLASLMCLSDLYEVPCDFLLGNTTKRESADN